MPSTTPTVAVASSPVSHCRIERTELTRKYNEQREFVENGNGREMGNSFRTGLIGAPRRVPSRRVRVENATARDGEITSRENSEKRFDRTVEYANCL